jgi:hypothetical protein
MQRWTVRGVCGAVSRYGRASGLPAANCNIRGAEQTRSFIEASGTKPTGDTNPHSLSRFSMHSTNNLPNVSHMEGDRHLVRINEITLIQVNAGLEGTTLRLLDNRAGQTAISNCPRQCPTAKEQTAQWNSPKFRPATGTSSASDSRLFIQGNAHHCDYRREKQHPSPPATHIHTPHSSRDATTTHITCRSLSVPSVVLSLRLSSRCLHPSPHTHCLTAIPPYS